MNLFNRRPSLGRFCFWLYFIGPAVAWAGLIFWLSAQSGESLPQIDVPQVDKAAHGAEYLILGLLAARAWGRGGAFRWRGAVWAWLLASIYGLTDEGHQLLVAGRTCDAIDWAVDCFAAAVGAMTWLRWTVWRRKNL